MTPMTFNYGDPVRVAQGYRYDEWKDRALWISGLAYDPITGGMNYTVSENWPPAGPGDMTAGFSGDDLGTRP